MKMIIFQLRTENDKSIVTITKAVIKAKVKARGCENEAIATFRNHDDKFTGRQVLSTLHL